MLDNWGIHLPLETPVKLQHNFLATKGRCLARLYRTQSLVNFNMIITNRIASTRITQIM